jgi:4-carboxymuconolactone decarboxylase
MGTCLKEADPRRVEEVILQSYLFLGYPAALNAFGLWRGISTREAGEAVPESWEEWSDRGREVCRIVYAGQYQDLRRNIRALHADMERWMVVEGYGKVLGRPELDLVTRELCIASLLAVLGVPRQLHSHLRGALNAGATLEEVEEAVEVASSFLPGGDSSVRAVWGQVRSRWGQASTGSEEVHRSDVQAET